MFLKEVLESIGETVYVSNKGDLAFDSEMKSLIYKKVPLKIEKLTKGGMVYLSDENGKFYSIPPINIYQ